jgi:hypothetical protein
LYGAFIRAGIVKLRPRRLEYAVELDRFVKEQLQIEKVFYEKGRPLLAAEEVDIFTDVLEEQDLKENSSELYATLCIQTVLTQKVEDFTTLCLEGLQERNELQDYKTNRHNNNVWSRACAYARDPFYNYIEPIKVVDVDPIKIESYYPVVTY